MWRRPPAANGMHVTHRRPYFGLSECRNERREQNKGNRPDTQDEVRIAENLIVNPEWQRDQDHIDNLESELHQALSRIEEYEAQLQTMQVNVHCCVPTAWRYSSGQKQWKKELEQLREERAEKETELTTQKKKFEEVKSLIGESD
ncbi:hypothetical protein B0H13DRAFT_1892402 [Mycena leptocephala]|nr:hypothetical protein B0H13DRAFT_1892402 [Mycena leptocephala]